MLETIITHVLAIKFTSDFTSKSLKKKERKNTGISRHEMIVASVVICPKSNYSAKQVKMLSCVFLASTLSEIKIVLESSC